MATDIIEAEKIPAAPPPHDPRIPHPPTDLRSEDEVPLESMWHRDAMNVLIETVAYHFRARNDFFVGGNMFLHFSEREVFNEDFRGPDFFFVWGVEPRPTRDYYATWEEGGATPNVIIEILSPSTAHVDRTIKRRLYQNRLRTPEYYLFDRTTESLEGFRLNSEGKYEKIGPEADGRLWSVQLELFVGIWEGSYVTSSGMFPRFYEPDGTLVPTFGEAAQAEAEVERRRAQTERRRAQAEQTKAEAERRRADDLETELERLRRELAALRGGESQDP